MPPRSTGARSFQTRVDGFSQRWSPPPPPEAHNSRSQPDRACPGGRAAGPKRAPQRPRTCAARSMPVCSAERVQCLECVLRADIAGGPGCERTATNPAHRSVEATNPGVKSGDDVGDAESTGVVHVQRQTIDRHRRCSKPAHRGDIHRGRNADRVGDAHLGNTACRQDPRRARRHVPARPLRRTGHPNAHRNCDVDSAHALARQLDDVRDLVERLSNGAIDVSLLKESVAAMVTSTLRTPCASASSSPRRLGMSTRSRARSCSSPASTAGASASCGTQTARDERRCLDARHARVEQPADEPDLRFRADGVGDVLEPVARERRQSSAPRSRRYASQGWSLPVTVANPRATLSPADAAVPRSRLHPNHLRGQRLARFPPVRHGRGRPWRLRGAARRRRGGAAAALPSPPAAGQQTVERQTARARRGGDPRAGGCVGSRRGERRGHQRARARDGRTSRSSAGLSTLSTPTATAATATCAFPCRARCTRSSPATARYRPSRPLRSSPRCIATR